MSDIDKFLTPESMLTPGLAGGMTMGITNALALQFALDAPQPAVIALVLSFVFGLCVFSSKPGRRAVKALFWVINSLVIFTVAAGSNSLGVATQSAQGAGAARMAFESLLPTAHAQAEVRWCCLDGGAVVNVSPAACQQQRGRLADNKAQALAVCRPAPPAPAARQDAPAKPPFFRPWVKPA